MCCTEQEGLPVYPTVSLIVKALSPIKGIVLNPKDSNSTGNRIYTRIYHTTHRVNGLNTVPTSIYEKPEYAREFLR